tara:strand:+ start:184 stop:645 length:462 start_codon:yes stop_codon:yes gene_type:complete
MRVRLATAEEIKEVVSSPDLLPMLVEDGFSGDFEPDMNQVWLLFEDDEDIIGIFNFTHITSICFEMHPMIYKKYRLKYARQCMDWAFMFFLETDKNKIIVQIPSDRPELVNFAKHHGFVEEGINRDSVMKEGKIMNIIQLGITKSEIASRKAA